MSSSTYQKNLNAQVAAGVRTQYVYDLSGVKYRTKSDLLTLQRQWNTFEKVENYNFKIYLQFLRGNFKQTWYQFNNNTEVADYRVGQQLHVNRYPNLPPEIFQSISLAPLPICTNGTGPPIFKQTPAQIVSVPAITEGQKIENNADMAIYVQVSTYNILHSTFTYQFTSNEEQLAYYRAERRLLAAAQAALHPPPIAGGFAV
jgi:hypothetical protein